MLNVAGFVVAASMVVGQAESTPESLKDLGAMIGGEWTGQVTADFDLEGVCKKGDKVDIKRTTDWVLDNLALISKSTYSVDGKPMAQGAALITWNAPKKQIRSYYTDSLGSTFQATWRKKGDSWVYQDRGLVGDGRKMSAKRVLIFDKSGDSYSASTTERIMGDEELPDSEVAFKRIK